MAENTQFQNFDRDELNKFEASATRWWDSQGEFKPLHEINPLRLKYINERCALNGKTVIDVGCGGGLLCEAMAAKQAQVTGIDIGKTAIQVAKLHLNESQLEVDYRHSSAEMMACELPAHYDIVTCMEMLEHVPAPSDVIQACSRLVKPGGDIFFSTINRNLKSFLLAIVAAEYLLNLLPKGTHSYDKLIKPSELAEAALAAGLELNNITGISYNPITTHYSLCKDISINYIAHFTKPE